MIIRLAKCVWKWHFCFSIFRPKIQTNVLPLPDCFMTTASNIETMESYRFKINWQKKKLFYFIASWSRIIASSYLREHSQPIMDHSPDMGTRVKPFFFIFLKGLEGKMKYLHVQKVSYFHEQVLLLSPLYQKFGGKRCDEEFLSILRIWCSSFFCWAQQIVMKINCVLLSRQDIGQAL